MKFRLLLVGLLAACTSQAAVVDTLKVQSPSMNNKLEVLVVTPEKKSSNPLPVVYLLHGYSGNARSWLEINPDIKKIADRDQMIIVCPDGKNSWYWDSPKNPSSRFETFVSKELIEYVDSHYPTIKNKKGRAITGLSMGGHGAMFLAFRHKDTYGAVGSTSGGVDIRPFPNNWEMAKQIGNESENRELWETHTAINEIDRLANGDLAIIFDCGYSDFFFEVNNLFHQKLLKYKIDHDFYVRPGAHNGEYWKNSIVYQLLFFKNFFDKNKK